MLVAWSRRVEGGKEMLMSSQAFPLQLRAQSRPQASGEPHSRHRQPPLRWQLRKGVRGPVQEADLP